MRILIAAVLALMVSGCTEGSLDKLPRTSNTDVVLTRNNYRVVEAGAVGSSSGFCLLGFICLSSPNYAEAQADLYARAGVNVSHRAIALANEKEGKSTTYLILFSVPSIKLTADVIEFIDQPSPQSAPVVNVIPQPAPVVNVQPPVAQTTIGIPPGTIKPYSVQELPPPLPPELPPLPSE